MKSSYNVEFNLDKYLNTVKDTPTIHYVGRVTYVNGLDIQSEGPRSVIGEICTIRVPSLNNTVMAEVVGLDGTTVKLSAFGNTRGIDIQTLAATARA